MSSAAALVERVRARRVDAAWTLPVAVALALVTWHVATVLPRAGTDNSWEIGLALAASHGLDFGRDVVFTYGPLGYLSVPLVIHGGLGGAAFLYAAAAQIAVAAVVVGAATRLYGRAVGLVVAFAALGLTLLVSDALAYLALFAVVWGLQTDELPPGRWFVPLAGFVAAFELLVKLNGGILCLALFALAAWRLAPRGLLAEAVLAGSFAVSLVVLWLATGNSLGALPDWLSASRHVVGSYTDAMALDPTGRSTETVLAVLLVVGAAVLVALHARRLPRARAIALRLAVAGFTYAYAKEGFVRHDAHVLDFFGAFAVALLSIAWTGRARWVAAGLVAGAAVATLVTPDVSLSQLYRPDVSARHAVRELRNVVDRHALAAARFTAQTKLGVPSAQLKLLSGHSVDVVPYEISAAWAYRLHWQPAPLLQWYMAYDAHLDELNARGLRADRVLRQRLTIATDGTVPEFEAPASYLGLLCNYRELAASGGWETLARMAGRCGEPRALQTVHAQAGEIVPVPSGGRDELVVAHVHLPGPGPLATIAKPFSLPRIGVGGNVYRLVAATASGPLVMRAPAAAGRSPFFGGFTEYDSLTLSQAATVDFDAISIGAQRAALHASSAPSGRIDGRVLRVGGVDYRVAPGVFQGWVDVARPAGRLAAITGWAVAPLVAAFADGKLVALVRPSQARPDVVAALHDQHALRSGYDALFPAGLHVRVFALGHGRATELNYPPGYSWG